MMRQLLFLALLIFGLSGCASRSATLASSQSQAREQVHFAGQNWRIKQGDYPRGPGGNYFSGRPENLWVDEQGHLHLRMALVDSIWRAVELISEENVGYGRYQITVEGQLSQLDPRVVFGLFTWDDHNFRSQANSEIDFEFSRWGHPLSESLLHFAAHPLAHTRLYLERRHSPSLPPATWDGVSTLVLYWAPTFILWETYRGEEVKAKNFLASFSLSNRDAPARRKYADGQRSEPIIIPAPGANTHFHFNLWLFGPEKKPYQAKEQKVIIRDFRYEPAPEQALKGSVSP